MQSLSLLMMKRAARRVICGLCIIVCIVAAGSTCTDDRSVDQSLSAVSPDFQSTNACCESTVGKSASQHGRWNVRPEFLSRSLVAVLHQRGLSVITCATGNLRRQFSQPSLFDMGIALRL